MTSISNSAPKPLSPKITLSKIAEVGITMGQNITGLYHQVASTASSIHQVVLPLVKEAKAANGVMGHMSAVSIVYTPFQAWDVGTGIAEAVLAPGVLKAYPSLKVISGTGSILDSFVSLIGALEQAGSVVMENSAAVLGPLGIAALVLQGAGIGVSAWQLHELDKQWNKVEELLGKEKDPNHASTKEEYSAAVEFLTDAPKTKTEKYRRIFFGIINDSQQKKVRQIFDKYQDEADLTTVKATFDELKKRHIQKKVQHALTIALLILGAIGVLILLFAPTPLAPIAWGIVAGTAAISIGVVAYNFFANRRFNQFLTERIKQTATKALT